MSNSTTKNDQKRKDLFARVETAQLLDIWEATDTNDAQEIPTVRGWIMDEMEKRNPAAFAAWMEDGNQPARAFFLPA